MNLKPGLFLIMFATVAVLAQDNPGTADAEQREAETTEEKPVGEEPEDKAPETFDPTEEVSEDYSIEFPVNI